MPSVLFVCTGNVCRSPAAAAIFRHLLRRRYAAQGWHVGSAGTWATPGAPIHPLVQRVLRELGIESGRHRARPVSSRLMAQADLVLGVTRHHVEVLRVEFPEHADRVRLLSEMAGHIFDIPDPSTMSLREVRYIVAEIHSVLDSAFEAIVEEASRQAQLASR